VQNLLAFRFSNPIFESVWNRNFLGSIQITVAEQIDIVERAGYYDEVGAVRDMVQNHILQVLALVTMDPPAGLNPVDIRAAKLALLRAVRPLDPAAAVAGQYDGYRGTAPGGSAAVTCPGRRGDRPVTEAAVAAALPSQSVCPLSGRARRDGGRTGRPAGGPAGPELASLGDW
jgi:hypothetical protein